MAADVVPSSVPRVSIGLPVHNGMPLLPEALESLLAQEVAELEIIVSDNASDDDTESYCRTVSEKDTRVRYSRNTENVGAAANFGRALSLARAPYFAWAAHDDRYHPAFISRCLARLEECCGSALCVPAHRRLDEQGRLVSVREEPRGLASLDLETRLRAYLWRRGWLTIYGLWRTDFLNRIGPPPPVWGCDVILVWKALLLAPAEVLSMPLADYRVVRGKSADSVMRGLTGSATTVHFPHSGMVASLRQASREVALSEADTRIANHVLRSWVLTHHYRELIATDFIEESRRLRGRGSAVRAAASLVPAALFGPRMALRGARQAVSGQLTRRK